jgi:hypothetical protein
MTGDKTAVVAWWGAVLSTIVFIWDIYKYRKAGPRLRFEVHAGMILVPSPDKREFISSTVTNYGDRSTTLTNIAIFYFENRWSIAHFRNRPTRAAVAYDLNTHQQFPWELKAGNVWMGRTEQTPELMKWGEAGVLYFDLYHSHSKKRIRRRVTFPRKGTA